MEYFVKKDEGRKVYVDFLTEKQQEQAEELLKHLQTSFPYHTQELAEQYGEGTSQYFYHMGVWIRSLIEQYDIPIRAYTYLFAEIASFAPDKERIRNVGDRRNPYYQAYLLSDLDESVVKKMSFNKWQSLLERSKECEDPRLFSWIGEYDQSNVSIKDWRNFLKLLHSYNKKIDSTVLNEEEVKTTYNNLLESVRNWEQAKMDFQRKNPKSKKLKDTKTINKWQSKYFDMILSDLMYSESLIDTNKLYQSAMGILLSGISNDNAD